MPLDDFDLDTPGFPGKTRHFNSVSELLTKLEGKAALYERIARDAKEQAEEFEKAAQAVRDGADSAIVGRTTYVLRPDTS